MRAAVGFQFGCNVTINMNQSEFLTLQSGVQMYPRDNCKDITHKQNKKKQLCLVDTHTYRYMLH